MGARQANHHLQSQYIERLHLWPLPKTYHRLDLDKQDEEKQQDSQFPH